MGSVVTLRPRSARTLGAAMMGVGALACTSTLVGGIDAVLRYAAPAALFAVLGWAAFWRPHVEVSDGGVVVVNTLRTVRVPWPAVAAVQGRYGLRLETPYGPITAWGASAPAGKQRARGSGSPAATAVADRLAELRAAGHLDQPRLEHERLPTRWHTGVVAALVLLTVATVLLPFGA